ncbi:MAG: hypothetical protein QHJ73_00430, partial [Armatimonadota bacterium]|nr:hypothetical protein [Armatimonadota bacterium]
GPSPHGMAWGNTPWDEAMQLPGSAQIGVGKRLLERYAWWRFEFHPEWIDPHLTPENTWAPCAAGIPGEVRVCYLPLLWYSPMPRVKALEPGVSYRAFLFDPVTGVEHQLGTAAAGSDGDWQIPLSRLPLYQDWVLVLETPKAARHTGG